MALALSRRLLLQAAAALAAGVAALPALAKAPRAQVQYQLTPKGGQHCSLCSYFLPGATAAEPGACKLVEGPIPPDGWCALFTAK